MSSSETDPSIRNQVWGAVDPSGQTRALVNAAVHGPNVPDWLERLGIDMGSTWDQLHIGGIEYRRFIEEIEAAVRVLVPRGWAVMTMQTEAINEAVHLVQSEREEEADELLTDQWEGEGGWRTMRVCKRVQVMGANDAHLNGLFRERARLLWLAKEHHETGHYEASIPLLQAQLEGIVMDVTGGKKFFTKTTQKANLVDPSKLVSIEAGLAALQATYGQGVSETQAKGSLSRHGIAHGRELAYDTRVNSAKTWSVLDALVGWAIPKARDLVAARTAESQAANMGSEEVAETGHRVDDREFSETRGTLRLLSTSAMGWYRQRGHFRDDLVGRIYETKDFTKKGLPAEHGVQEQVSEDSQEVMYWRETVSGWVLGNAITAQDGRFAEYLYAGPRPPGGLPSTAVGDWGGLSEGLPDWT
ncbi:hypothetical protein [Citricoccus nitrophenolicus]|uniref:hypothetical protein n=1 Tax=Citricoccus nitrophenolicus TaxID=863575 RepID=UPI0031E71D5E